MCIRPFPAQFPLRHIRTHSHVASHVCEAVSGVCPLARVYACVCELFHACACVHLLSYPSLRISSSRNSEQGQRRVAIKESSYFVPHEEKQRAVDSSTSPSPSLFLFPRTCHNAHNCLSNDANPVFNGLINARGVIYVEEGWKKKRRGSVSERENLR